MNIGRGEKEAAFGTQYAMCLLNEALRIGQMLNDFCSNTDIKHVIRKRDGLIQIAGNAGNLRDLSVRGVDIGGCDLSWKDAGAHQSLFKRALASSYYQDLIIHRQLGREQLNGSCMNSMVGLLRKLLHCQVFRCVRHILIPCVMRPSSVPQESCAR